jgi:DNA-binding MarR family transcriptional regulator
MKDTFMPEPRWLTPAERENWVAYLLATRLLWARLERDMQRGAGMPLTYYEILSVLSETPGHAMRMTDLSAALQVSPSRLSHAASRLEESGLIRRERASAGRPYSPTDRRGWVAVLTDEGMAVVQKAAPIHVQSVRTQLFDRLSPAQMNQLGEISRTLLTHLAPDSDRSDEIARRTG